MPEFKTPGQLVKSLLDEKGWSKRTPAIVAGKQSLDAQTALLLEGVFGVAAERFLGLQRDFDLAVARGCPP